MESGVSSASEQSAIREVADRLLGPGVREVRAVGAGANSRMFCVETSNGPLALKSYSARLADRHVRADNEWKALHFLRRVGAVSVPAPLAVDPVAGILVMEWIDGVPVDAIQAVDIIDAASFITRIFVRSADTKAVEFPPAAEACLSASEIVAQIERRIPQLEAALDVGSFIGESFRPALAAAIRELRSELANAAPLEPAHRRLIPADFGFHNALRERSGALRYFDFDYFGWDDPAKLAADFILHPGMKIDGENAHLLVSQLAAALPNDGDFVSRVNRHRSLYALRWALIVLNPFRGDRVQNLPGTQERLDILRRDRLAKAAALVARASHKEWVGSPQ